MEKTTDMKSTSLKSSLDAYKCEVCGNVYDKSFEVHLNGEIHIFDSFECAIHALAPVCSHCGCKIVGHGVEANGVFYCCAHCASGDGVPQIKDRVETELSQV